MAAPAPVAPNAFDPAISFVTTQVLNPPCICGRWMWYFSLCGHLYQDFKHWCGQTRTKWGMGTSLCLGTSTHDIISSQMVSGICQPCGGA